MFIKMIHIKVGDFEHCKIGEELLKFLVHKYGEIEILINGQELPIFLAQNEYHHELEILFDYNLFDINTKFKCGRTLLMCASEVGDIKMMEVLVNSGSKIHDNDLYKFLGCINKGFTNNDQFYKLLEKEITQTILEFIPNEVERMINQSKNVRKVKTSSFNGNSMLYFRNNWIKDRENTKKKFNISEDIINQKNKNLNYKNMSGQSEIAKEAFLIWDQLPLEIKNDIKKEWEKERKKLSNDIKDVIRQEWKKEKEMN